MHFFSEISEPFIPETSNKLKSCLGKLNDDAQWPNYKEDFESVFEKIEIGECFDPIENLFVKIADAEVLELEKRFAGSNE